VLGGDPINHRGTLGITEVTQSKILNYFFIGVRVLGGDPINHRDTEKITEFAQRKNSVLNFNRNKVVYCTTAPLFNH
jgi:organic radical activating enzyme